MHFCNFLTTFFFQHFSAVPFLDFLGPLGPLAGWPVRNMSLQWVQRLSRHKPLQVLAHAWDMNVAPSVF